ncbi:MAG: hypothetical protein JWP27_770 [Flaviaesturariibacter sp.]|nr:hypothetical protein [Flaviaesturariibacter sp.]
MRTTITLILGAATVVLAAVIIRSARRKKAGQMQEAIADEGYETAHDILYPRRGRHYGDQWHYGPVLPN